MINMTELQYYFYDQGRHDAYFKEGVRYDNYMNDDNRQAYIKGYETGLEDLAIDKELQNEHL
jgi:hypothetical protein